jgi:hypothetical protein
MGFSSFPSLDQFSKSLCLERSFFKGIHDWFSLRDSPGYQTRRHYAPFTLVLGPCPRAFLHPLACFFRSASFYGCPFSLSHSLCHDMGKNWNNPLSSQILSFLLQILPKSPPPVSFPYFPSLLFCWWLPACMDLCLLLWDFSICRFFPSFQLSFYITTLKSLLLSTLK